MMDKMVLTSFNKAELENIVLDCLKAFHEHKPEPEPEPSREDMAQLLTKKEAARLLACSPSTIDSYRRAGVLKATMIGRAVRFTRGEVLGFIAAREK